MPSTSTYSGDRCEQPAPALLRFEGRALQPPSRTQAANNGWRRPCFPDSEFAHFIELRPSNLLRLADIQCTLDTVTWLGCPHCVIGAHTTDKTTTTRLPQGRRKGLVARSSHETTSSTPPALARTDNCRNHARFPGAHAARGGSPSPPM